MPITWIKNKLYINYQSSKKLFSLYGKPQTALRAQVFVGRWYLTEQLVLCLGRLRTQFVLYVIITVFSAWYQYGILQTSGHYDLDLLVLFFWGGCLFLLSLCFYFSLKFLC